ncbi:MAG TPA: ATP-binding protein [Pyrinomonadaceae bacterium]|nr:ATP-binding protein [Pyrinomonadaceae bacterium]
MIEATAVNWAEANQQYLMARLLLVREALSQFAKRNEKRTADGDALLEDLNLATSNLPGPAALDHLCAAFNLSPFERDVLLLCAGVELDSSFAELCIAAQSDSHRAYPTFGLALAALPEAHWSAISPAAPLRYWRLIEVGTNDTITRSQLRIDERVLHYLAGVSGLDARLQGLIEPVHSHATLPSSHQELSQQIARLWQTKDATSWPIINLCGDQPAANQAVAAFTCHLCNVPLNLLRAVEIPSAVAEREALSRLWEREAALGGGALLIDCDEIENTRALNSLLENVRGMLIVVSREPVRLWRRRIIRFDVRKSSASEQKLLWQQSLGANLDGELNLLVSQFSLEAQTISTVSALAIANQQLDDASLLNDLWGACRTQARSRLDDLAQRIEPFATWDDIVLPESQRRTLRDIAAHVRQRSKVYETWGFAARGDRGLGISAMFAGVSGTGKTMAAEVLANELQLDLYRIDLSQVVSKYIGETEKNLRRVFDAAEEGGAILLFDEADALFGKRTEVRDSHDRYANIEVSYLLQRMESYRGLAILTTNMKSVLDTAFLRRIRFIVHFPFPDMVHRAEIWRRIFPFETPTEDLDNSKLARLNIAGGNIRNIALHAAFLAADAGKAVGMRHLLHAARSEYAKLEKPLTDTETANWL